MSTVADRIVESLKFSGIKKAELARRCDVSPQAVQKWINIGSIDRTNLAKVARATNVSFEWLATGQGEMRPTLEAPAHLDKELLVTVIKALESGLELEKMTLDADKKAQVIELLYSYYLKGNQRPMDTGEVIKLIKLAS